MSRFAYYSSPAGFGQARGQALTALTGLPAWGRWIIAVLALPGIVLVALSLVILLASVAALLILTVPAYTLLRNLTAPSAQRQRQASDANRPPARRVEATVIGPSND